MGMSITEISEYTETTKQNVQQTISRAIKKLYKNLIKEYKVTHSEAFEMLICGLNVNNEDDIKYVFNNLKKSDKMKIQTEGI